LAIALPVLTLLALGVADFGRMFRTGIAVANAARAAAEFGASSVDNSADTSKINQAGRDDGADVAGISVTSERFCRCPDGTTPACDGTCTAPYTATEVFVKAKANATINLILRYPGIPASMTFRDSATFRAQ
jgi:Flp pilus assembly protein TadG